MENWKFALSSIMGHKMRSILTMLGIIIGVTAVVIIMALGNGMKQSVLDSLTGNKKEVQLYYQGDDDVDDPYAAYYSDIQQKVKPEWLDQIVANTDGIDSYYLTNGASSSISYRKKNMKNVTITGVSQDYFNIKTDSDYKVLAGRTFTQEDYSNFSRIIMIDTVLSDTLFGKGNYSDALNKVIDLDNNSYLVIGVFKTENTAIMSYGASGQAIMTNTQVAMEFSTNEVGQIFLHVTDARQSQTLGQSAAEQLNRLANVKNGHYTITDLSAIIDDVNQQVGIMTAVVGSTAAISLLVGGIGVMNIMLVSVTERTREIGLRKALGATRVKILVQFLIESVVLTVIGGLIGLGLAYFVASIIANSQSQIKPVVSLNAAIISMIFSAVIGIIFGLLPANKASRLNPIEALRYE